MSKQLINKYRNKIHNIIKFSGARSEGAISRAFGDLLGDYAEKQNLMLVEQVEVNSMKGTRIRPDGVLKNAMQLDFGFWEAKKADVDLDREIQDKINKGYPLTNTIFEDSRRAVLFQDINYETVEKYDLKRTDADIENPKPKLRADKENGIIYLDSQTTLHNIPETAWDYKLGNRSALEWILDQYKEKKPRDKTIREKFNNYKFADHKEQVIELLERICTVSVETMKIVGKMKAE